MSKVAIVTGSSRGIGRACALRLAKEGMDVVVNYNSNEAEAMKVVNAIKDMGQDAIAIKANTGNQNDVKNMFREAFKHFGHIDVLVNNAGVLDDAYLLAINSDSLDRSMDVNVKGYFYCCQQAALKMFKTGGYTRLTKVFRSRTVYPLRRTDSALLPKTHRRTRFPHRRDAGRHIPCRWIWSYSSRSHPAAGRTDSRRRTSKHRDRSHPYSLSPRKNRLQPYRPAQKSKSGTEHSRWNSCSETDTSDDSSVNIRFALPVCGMKGSLLPIRITYLSHIFFS